MQSLGQPILFCCILEAFAHLSFLITGHRGKVLTGTWLKYAWDSLDILTHAALAFFHPQQTILCALHFLMFVWHVAKAVDSFRINGYSPLRGLFLPNCVDTASYTFSAATGMYQNSIFGCVTIFVYGSLRIMEYVY